MKKVLILSSKPPFPVCDGAAIRTFQSIKFCHDLSYSVDVLYLTNKECHAKVVEGLKEYCNNVIEFKVPILLSYLFVLWGLLFGKLPLQVYYYMSPKAKKWIKNNQNNYDVIYCNNIRTAEYAVDCKNYKIIDYVDAISMNYIKAMEYSKGLWRFLYSIDAKRCLKYERYLLTKFDKKIIISDVDKQYIINNKNEEIFIIENYIKINPSKYIIQVPNIYNIVFVGSMFYEPNIVAVKYFVKEVLPLIKNKYPNTKFYIVGNRPSKEVLALSSDSVIVTGFVEDVWDYLKSATVVVAPMQTGAGLQNKILEALSVRACVVTTPIGFEGLIHDEGAPLVADSNEIMAQIICELFGNSVKREMMGLAAFTYVERYYSEKVVFDKFKSILIV